MVEASTEKDTDLLQTWLQMQNLVPGPAIFTSSSALQSRLALLETLFARITPVMHGMQVSTLQAACVPAAAHLRATHRVPELWIRYACGCLSLRAVSKSCLPARTARRVVHARAVVIRCSVACGRVACAYPSHSPRVCRLPCDCRYDCARRAKGAPHLRIIARGGHVAVFPERGPSALRAV